jgi:glycosyltransferase involved in cell wall biosynthesis
MKLIIFESHPVQYRAPVYRDLQKHCPDQFEVIYGTDLSAKGWVDRGFGKEIRWDTPLMEGYPCRVLTNLQKPSLGGFKSLSGEGVHQILDSSDASTVLFTQFIYQYDLVAYFSALRQRKRLWIRQETQDEAFIHGRMKGLYRSLIYRALYSRIHHAFYFGVKNRRHLLAHGFREDQLTRAPYATVDTHAGQSDATLLERRRVMRDRLGLEPETWVIGFSGKFIGKKDPLLVLEAASFMAERSKVKLCVLMLGSGKLEDEIRHRASELERAGVAVLLPGFVNQSALGDYYLAMDALVLPSRRLGETWGLVVNEALQAGCSVVMTDAVGCSEEFGSWERVRVIPVGDRDACAAALGDLADYPRDVGWCRNAMLEYSIEAAASGLAERINELP